MRQTREIKSKKDIKMSTQEFGFKEAQLLLSQIIHDLISLFTSLSAGIDFAQDTQGEVWELVKKTKDQMYAQISLFRFVFGAGEGNLQDANKIIDHFGKAFDVEIKGTIKEYPKIWLALTLWLVKQIKIRQGSILTFETKKIILSSTHLIRSCEQDDIVKGVRRFHSCQESYAGYSACLLFMDNKALFISRSSTEVSIELDLDPSDPKNLRS